MDLEMLKGRIPHICDYQQNKEFAVLIPIVNIEGKLFIVFEVRSGRLLKQPNEICFPGGKIEAGEKPLQAAVRETCEELLIEPGSIEVLGQLDTLVTPFNTIIYAFAAVVENYQGSYNPDEVQEIFYVPLDYLENHPPLCSNLEVSMKPDEDFPYEKIQFGRNYPWAKGRYPVYIYDYQDKHIWGITARILKNLLELTQSKKSV